MSITVLAVGDVVGSGGIAFLETHLKAYKKTRGIDFCVVNGENANVVGATPRQCDAILKAGADVITLGNHTWTRWELQPYLDEKRRVLRPANFGPQCPGRGWEVFDTPKGKVLVLNLMGRFTLDTNTDNPFVMADSLFQELPEGVKVALVDFHAEATSEKGAMAYLLDGRASAVWGTHTHVQTSDAQVLEAGTGFITDLGMTGPRRSVLGIRPEQSVGKFLGDVPRRYESPDVPCKLEGCVFTIDTETGKCIEAEAVRLT